MQLIVAIDLDVFRDNAAAAKVLYDLATGLSRMPDIREKQQDDRQFLAELRHAPTGVITTRAFTTSEPFHTESLADATADSFAGSMEFGKPETFKEKKHGQH